MRFLQSIGCLAPAATLIYGLVGLLLLGQFGGQTLDYLTSMGWEQVSGTVVSSEVVDEWDTTGERYLGQVVYSYEVDGVAYEGDQLSLGGLTYLGNREDAEQRIAPYPVGAAVTPYVDPADPTRALLDRNLPGAVWGFVGFGAALVLLSLLLGARHLMTYRKRD